MRRVTIVRKRQLTDRIAEFHLQPADGRALPDWEAGAHIEVTLDGVGSRAYSLIRWPGQAKDVYQIAVQREEAGQGGSTAMHALGMGDELHISDPKNSFALQPGSAPVLLLAGGIGVTPLISMACTLADQGRRFAIHYAGRQPDVMAYEQELQQAFPETLSCHYDNKIPLNLAQICATAQDHHVYICGPKAMIDAARTAAEGAGVPSDHIHVELFATPEASGAKASFEVQLASTGAVYTIPPDSSIIDVLEASGVDVMYDCQRGDCGICQVDVLEGVPDHRDVVLSGAEKDSGKVMQICVSRARSARLVLDI